MAHGELLPQRLFIAIVLVRLFLPIKINWRLEAGQSLVLLKMLTYDRWQYSWFDVLGCLRVKWGCTPKP